MNDMSQVIIPKSDQINAETLLAGPMTVTIREVQIRGGQEQPVSILLEETDLAYRPCKSMSRVLVSAWGPDANAYKGRSLTLYRDPTVKWGGLEVGGIRISHMSHIDRAMTMALTATKGSRKPFTVAPLVPPKRQTSDPAATWANGYLSAIEKAADRVDLEKFAEAKSVKLEELREKRPDLHEQCIEALEARRAFFAPEGRDDEQHGDQFDDADAFDPAEFCGIM